MPDSPTLLLRLDAGPRRGMGHAMRSLALAQAWRAAGGQVVCAMAEGADTLAGRLQAEGIACEALTTEPGSDTDAARTVEAARRARAAWVLVDGYHFDGGFQTALRRAGLKLLMLDDFGHAGRYPAHLVLNPQPDMDPGLYADRARDTRLLLGPEFVLLRREFRTQAVDPIRPEARRVLVTLGGADPEDLTTRVVSALTTLAASRPLEARVVAGDFNPRFEALAAALEAYPTLTLVRRAEDMPALMAWADVAVSAAGSTCWELAYLGLPALVVTVADNQRPIAAHLSRERAAVDLGWHIGVTPDRILAELAALLDDAPRRSAMRERLRTIIDGRGADRVLAEMAAVAPTVRPAQLDDARWVHTLASDPDTRANSFNSEPIPWEVHAAWFAERLSEDSMRMFVAVDAAGTPVGFVRFAIDRSHEAEIGVIVDPARRGEGWGSRVIEAGLAQVFATTEIGRIHAYIRPENVPSLRAFERAGFLARPRTTCRGHEACHLVAERTVPFYEVSR